MEKLFSVGIWEEQSGYVAIMAKSQKEANAKVLQMTEDLGLDNIAIEHKEITYSQKHRDVELV